MKMMKFTLLAVLAASGIALACTGFSGGNEPWAKEQLMPPAALADAINKGQTEKLHIFDIGPSGQIKGAVEIGEGRNKENLAKLKSALQDVPRNETVVVYCGCCPFKNCPNIRPAFELLKEMQFTDPRLLDLSENLKVDWIDRGYPME